jgi:hypothetical protein
MNWENVMVGVDFLKALLTPAIAVLTAVIAVAQYRLAEAKYRHDLYERRSAIYKAAMKFIAQVTSGGDAPLDEAHTFLRDTSEVAFIFKKSTAEQIQAFLDTLYKQGLDPNTTNRLLESERGVEASLREQHAERKNDLLFWFGKQFDECRRLFGPELSLV